MGESVMTGYFVVRPLRHDDPAGTHIQVVEDNQGTARTKTRSRTWTVAENQVVLLEGRTGRYLVKRCSVISPPEDPAARERVANDRTSRAVKRIESNLRINKRLAALGIGVFLTSKGVGP